MSARPPQPGPPIDPATIIEPSFRKRSPIPPAARPPWWHPSSLLATWFTAGLFPLAPGTVGSLAALPPALVLIYLGGKLALVLGLIAVMGLGIWAGERYMRAARQHDPGEVVIDEVAGMWLILLVVEPLRSQWLLAFALFRLFDVTKPWPVRAIDRRMGGAVGVMLDDLLAAAYAIATFFLIKAGGWL